MVTIFDIGIILLFIMFIIVGLKRGVIKETVSLLAIVLVFVLSFALKGLLGDVFCTILPFLSFGGMVTLNIIIYQLLAFLIVFSLLLCIYELSIKISKFLQKLVNVTIILWLPSKILGGVVSFIKGYLIIFVVLFLLMIPLGKYSIFRDSYTVNFVLYKSPIMAKYTKSFTKPVLEVVDIGKNLSNKKISINEANLESLDIMLKYKIVSKKMVENLVELNKLDSVDNIDSILNKY